RSLIKEVAHAARADAHKHLNELRAGDREEGHARLASNSPRKHRLARARRANEQHATRNASAQRIELVRILKELYDLGQLLLGLVHARHIGEGNRGLVAGNAARPRLAERHRLAVSALRLPHHKDERANQDEGRKEEAEDAEATA